MSSAVTSCRKAAEGCWGEFCACATEVAMRAEINRRRLTARRGRDE